MAINDLPSPNENKATLLLSLQLKKIPTDNIMDKPKYSNNEDIVSTMERYSRNHASSSQYIPTPNDCASNNSINTSQLNVDTNYHKPNYNSSNTNDTNLLGLNVDDEIRNSVNDTIGSKEEVDLIELLGRDWPVQAGDSLTNILNSDYNYNKDTISKQDYKKYEINHRLKHTQNRYSLNSERNKSMNPISHLISERKFSEQPRNHNFKTESHIIVNKLNDNTSSLKNNKEQKTDLTNPSGLEDYLPRTSTSVNTQCNNSQIKYESVFAIEGSDLGIGSMIQVITDISEPLYGVLKWLGKSSENSQNIIAGVELEEEHPHLPLTLTNGVYCGKKMFDCPTNRALFIPFEQCQPDERFVDQKRSLQPGHSRTIEDLDSRLFGNVECLAVPGSIAPLSKTSDLESVCGKFKGIQGHHNSCYLDATLFSMFTFTSVFDALLFRPKGHQDSDHYEEVQTVLREEIVNPLRKNLFVRADKVMKLRKLLEKLSSVTGLTCEEKDPEEFLNCLLSQILNADPFLKLNSGQEAFYYQLFVEKDERLLLPSVQQLFEQSFLTSDIKLKQVPSCLIIQMPRFGKSYKMYPRILPSQLLDVTDIIEDSPRQCTVCGKLAHYECKDCFGQCGMGLESTAFCKPCLDTVHSHAKRANHKVNIHSYSHR